jgi:hypothetical protein
MPFIVTKDAVTSGRTVDAILAADRNRLHVQVQLVNDGRQILVLPGDVRDVISSVSQDGKIEIAVSPGSNSRAAIASVRHARLAKASRLLEELTRCLQPISAEHEESDLAELLQSIFDWIRDERERAKEPPRSTLDSESNVPKKEITHVHER